MVQTQEAQRNQLQAAQVLDSGQLPHYLMKGQGQQQPITEDSVEQRSNFNISPLLMGNQLQKLGTADMYLNSKEDQTSQRKLQK